MGTYNLSTWAAPAGYDAQRRPSDKTQKLFHLHYVYALWL
jgi:hypothetical protein